MRTYLALERALRAGDLEAVTALFPATAFPDVRDPYTGTPLLALAISWAPLAMIQELLDAGVTVDHEAQDGFPCLVGAILSGRADRLAVTRALLDAGADLTQRGLNDWTPLHAAATLDDPQLVELLLDRGADPRARTRIDDCATPEQEAVRLGKLAAAAALRDHRT
jgi:ankyrin repeat protein